MRRFIQRKCFLISKYSFPDCPINANVYLVRFFRHDPNDDSEPFMYGVLDHFKKTCILASRDINYLQMLLDSFYLERFDY